MTVQLEYINHLSKIFPIMLALCSVLSVTHYAQNDAGIIGWSLLPTHPCHPHPLPPAHPLICAICNIIVAMKKVVQNPAVLAS